jgi:hypothetical protein
MNGRARSLSRLARSRRPFGPDVKGYDRTVSEPTAELYASRGWYFLSTYSDRQSAAYRCFAMALELPDPSGEQHERALLGIERLGQAKPRPRRSSRASRAVEKWPKTQTYMRNGTFVTRTHPYAGQETRASRIRRTGN